ncbi:MAG: hypothetical protein LIO42_03785 [Oscillospiraceae bacterium]|nr:hypothetical protein [Oscillospiraceae bacterium]
MKEQNLFQRWLTADGIRAKDLAAANALDHMETMAAELEAEDTGSISSFMMGLYECEGPGEKNTPERLDEYHIRILDAEAAKVVHEWALDQITPTAAVGLADLVNAPWMNDTQIILCPSWGPEYICNILALWTERHPGVLVCAGDEDGPLWRPVTEITLKEYAELHGRSPVSVRQMAARGSLKTARKVGRDWVVSADEPYPDHRRKGNGPSV